MFVRKHFSLIQCSAVLNIIDFKEIKMRQYLYPWLCLNFIAVAYGIPNKTCDRIRIADRFYDRVVLKKFNKPYNLNVHKTSNTLFFSYVKPLTYSDMDFHMAYYNMDSKYFDVIPGLKGGCAIAVDQINDVVYLGGSDGIYRYNMMTKIADKYKEQGKNVWSLFFKEKLFYIQYPSQTLYIDINDTFTLVKEFEDFEVDNFYVTSSNVIFFANKTGFYKYNNLKMTIHQVNDFLFVRQIVEDNDENVYISSNKGVFMYVPLVGLKKIINMKNVYGLAFDKHNNFIYSDEKSIVRLQISKNNCEEQNTW